MISEWDANISTKHTTFMIFVSGVLADVEIATNLTRLYENRENYEIKNNRISEYHKPLHAVPITNTGILELATFV